MDVGTVLALVSITGNLVTVCGKYVRRVKHAQEDILQLQNKAEQLQRVLKELAKLPQELGVERLPAVREALGVLTECSDLVKDLCDKLDAKENKKPARKYGFRSWAWPLQKSEADDAISRIDGYISLFQAALQADQLRATHRLEQKFDLRNLKIAEGAAFNFYANDSERKECLDGTREELLAQIERWAESSQGKCIFWLKGGAGTGKSTISQTIARRLKRKNLYAGSFFFKRGEGDRSNAKRLFPTLVQQLMERVPELKPVIQRVLDDDPYISEKALGEQFEKLVLQPFLDVDIKTEVTLVAVIDALDECGLDVAKEDIKTVLKLLPRVQESKQVTLRFFLTSRPEMEIRDSFRKISDQVNLDLFGDVPIPQITSDISKFLRHSFSEIQQFRRLDEDWAGEQAIQSLVTKAVPLFLSATIFCRFIRNAFDPTDRLQRLLADKSTYLSEMAKTYLPVLKQLLFEEDKQEIAHVLHAFKQIVGAIIMLATPLSINALSGLLALEAKSIKARLDWLHSVLNVPEDCDLPVRMLHLSFRDFLLDEQTKTTEESNGFWIDGPRMHQTLAKQCIEIMDRKLTKNICKLTDDGYQQSQISPQTIEKYLPPDAQYACRYWTQHLVQSKDPSSALAEAYPIVRTHFLHWMEAMSILGLIPEVIEAFNQLLSVPLNDDHAAIGVSEFLNDARRFVFKNRQIAETAPLQLYSSALMFSPKSSVIRTLFANELKIWPQLPIVEESWNAELQTLEGHTDQVHSLCGSADGQRLASGCRDGTIKLWDSATGQLQQTLSGHSDIVILINFSHDNQQLISASADGVIKLWDATTGELQQTIENHSDWVDTVVFSPDNRQIASYLEDGTVKVWKATARKTLQALEECPSPVDSIALQPDGQQVVSELEDQTFKPRDFDLRQRLQTLEKDSGSIGRVAFSPDGQRLASSSKDGIIMLWVPTADTLQPGKQFRSRGPALLEFSPDGQKLAAASNDMVELWNIEKGVVEGTCDGRSHRPDEYGRITSLRFSSDGRNLAFDPFDKTIRVWNLTSDPPQIFSGHSRAITSFVFLPGRQQLASASEDRTIKIWDLTAGKSQHSTNEKGFSGSTKSIAFSPDGGQLATGLSDGTIKIWDPSTGKMTQRFQAHEYAVQSVAFSAKGYRPLVLASGSDTTIRLWDPQTGQKAWPLQPIHSAEVRSLCFLPDNRLVSGWSSGHITVRNIKVWNTTTSQRDKTISAHEASVESISFTEDGQMVSGSDDGTCKLWDLAASTDQPKQVFHSVDGDYAASMQKIAISPQDQQLAGSSPNGPTNVWNLSENPSRQIHERHSNWVWTTSGARISILDGQWICLNGERTLWLPKQYRADCLAVSHERIALGHPSGNVSFIMMPQAHA